MRRYLITAVILTAVFLLGYYLLNGGLFQGYLHPQFPTMIGFFFFQSLIISWMLRSAEKDQENFPLYALGSIIFRFISGILMILVFWIAGVTELTALLIQFMGVYLTYLIFELIVVLANLRRN